MQDALAPFEVLLEIIELDLGRLDIGIMRCNEGIVDKLVGQIDLLAHVADICDAWEHSENHRAGLLGAKAVVTVKRKPDPIALG